MPSLSDPAVPSHSAEVQPPPRSSVPSFLSLTLPHSSVPTWVSLSPLLRNASSTPLYSTLSASRPGRGCRPAEAAAAPPL